MTIEILKTLDPSNYGWTYKGPKFESYLRLVRARLSTAQTIIENAPHFFKDEMNLDDLMDFVNDHHDNLTGEEHDNLLVVATALRHIEK